MVKHRRGRCSVYHGRMAVVSWCAKVVVRPKGVSVMQSIKVALLDIPLDASDRVLDAPTPHRPPWTLIPDVWLPPTCHEKLSIPPNNYYSPTRDNTPQRSGIVVHYASHISKWRPLATPDTPCPMPPPSHVGEGAVSVSRHPPRLGPGGHPQRALEQQAI